MKVIRSFESLSPKLPIKIDSILSIKRTRKTKTSIGTRTTFFFDSYSPSSDHFPRGKRAVGAIRTIGTLGRTDKERQKAIGIKDITGVKGLGGRRVTGYLCLCTYCTCCLLGSLFSSFSRAPFLSPSSSISSSSSFSSISSFSSYSSSVSLPAGNSAVLATVIPPIPTIYRSHRPSVFAFHSLHSAEYKGLAFSNLLPFHKLSFNQNYCQKEKTSTLTSSLLFSRDSNHKKKIQILAPYLDFRTSFTTMSSSNENMNDKKSEYDNVDKNENESEVQMATTSSSSSSTNSKVLNINISDVGVEKGNVSDIINSHDLDFDEKGKGKELEKIVKRRLAFVFGYLGTHYNGLQKATPDGSVSPVSTFYSTERREDQSAERNERKEGITDSEADISDKKTHDGSFDLENKIKEEKTEEEVQAMKEKEKEKDKENERKNKNENENENENEIVTIEGVFEEALYKAGLVRESNYGSLEKIGWARCSRTDKGVHAVRNVVSAKCEVLLSDIDEQSQHSTSIKDRINAVLPDDIHLFEATKVGKSFRPREVCGYREYEYLIPMDMLRPLGSPEGSSFDEDLVIKKLEQVLKMYEGTNNFHNFTKLKSRELARKVKSKFSNSSKQQKENDWKTEGGKREKNNNNNNNDNNNNNSNNNETCDNHDSLTKKDEQYKAKYFNRNKELQKQQQQRQQQQEQEQGQLLEMPLILMGEEDLRLVSEKKEKKKEEENLQNSQTQNDDYNDSDYDDDSTSNINSNSNSNDYQKKSRSNNYRYQNDEGSTENIATRVYEDGFRYYNTDITLNSLFHILYNRYLEDLEFDRLREERRQRQQQEREGQEQEEGGNGDNNNDNQKRQRLSVYDTLDHRLQAENKENDNNANAHAHANKDGSSGRNKEASKKDLDSDLPLSLWDLQKHQGVLKMIRTSLFGCDVRKVTLNNNQIDNQLTPTSATSQRYVAVSFRGQSFLYNQIRLLIGAAIAVAMDVLPLVAVEASLKSPFLVHIPLAPAVGLYLKNLNFNRKTKNPILMSQQDLFTMPNTNKTEPVFLMSDDSFEEANRFEEAYVLKQVHQEWWEEDSNAANNKNAIENFRNFCLRHQMSSEVQNRLEKVYGKWKKKMDLYDQEKAERELKRRAHFVDRINERNERNNSNQRHEDDDANGKGNQNGNDIEKEKYSDNGDKMELENNNDSNSTSTNKHNSIKDMYRVILPQRFATDLITHFRLKPGKAVADIQRAVAQRMLDKEIPTEWDTTELLKYVEETGIEILEEEGGKIRLN